MPVKTDSDFGPEAAAGSVRKATYSDIRTYSAESGRAAAATDTDAATVTVLQWHSTSCRAGLGLIFGGAIDAQSENRPVLTIEDAAWLTRPLTTARVWYWQCCIE